MAYVKPGVEITQVQNTATPVLIAPDLEAVVVGKGYYWQDPTLDSSEYSVSYSGASMTINLSDINSDFNSLVSVNDEDLIVVDLYGSATVGQGTEVKHLVKDTDWSYSNGDVTLVSGITTPGSGSAYELASVKIGFRADNSEAMGFKKSLASPDDIKDVFGGEIVSWNPLAYGAKLAQDNASASVNTYCISGVSSISTEMSSARSALALEEVYAIGVLDSKAGSSGWKSHVEDYSDAVNKKERIVFLTDDVVYGDYEGNSTSEKTTIAETLRTNNATFQSKRMFMVHPDVAYTDSGSRHISTAHPDWIDASFKEHTGFDMSSRGAYALFAKPESVGNKNYKVGDKITSSVHAELVSAGYHSVFVFSPIPGFYFNAANAGLCVGVAPEAPLSNVPISGISRTYGSQDYFTEAQMNTMAEGGTYIMTQLSSSAPIVSRHQTSTDVTSVAKRELSITKALDYTAKFLRKGLNPYIGRHVVTPAFLKMLESVLISQGLFLVRAGVLNDLQVASVKQDDANPDTIQVELSLLVKYPVNYIKIKMVF